MLSLESIVKEIGADSAAIMIPDVTVRHLYCYDSYNMPTEWVEIKNSFDENVPGGNVEVYKSGKPATTNHLKKDLNGHYIESVMIIPIKREDITVAMLELIHSDSNKAFSDFDLEKATQFAIEIEPELKV